MSLSKIAFLGRLSVFPLTQECSKNCYAQTVNSNRDEETCLVLIPLVLFHQERKMAEFASLYTGEGVCGGKKGLQ